MNDGVSRFDRYQRIHSVKPFTVIDNKLETLFRQAKTIAGFIRYYHLSGKEDGYFDAFFTLQELYHKYNGQIDGDGEMEPSQSLLVVFLQQLQEITQRFNRRWEAFILWYLNDCLQVVTEEARPDSAWLAFTKNTTGKTFVRKNTGFTYEGAAATDRIIFRTTEPILVTDAMVEKAFSLHFDRSEVIYPSCLFNLITALKIKNLPDKMQRCEALFGGKPDNDNMLPVGVCISSPLLLLREGKRYVSITFETEPVDMKKTRHIRNLVRLFQEIQRISAPISRNDAKEVLLVKVFSDIFYLEISTKDGWEPVEKYVVHRHKTLSFEDPFQFTLSFELHEYFPATHGCKTEIHEVSFPYPALRILLNRDAWLYPYSWLKDFMMARIHLHAEVTGVNNIQIYNELGNIDNSIPFAPFGTNTENGAWFVIGNYEMSVKNVQQADISICWQQLPGDEGGLYAYYQGYQKHIDNRSFKMKARYLSDYKWKDTATPAPLYLFSTIATEKDGGPVPQRKLSDETCLKNIQLAEMNPVYQAEEEYQYNIRSKSGFFSLILTSPDIGFGEKTYRRVFSDLLIKKTLRKKKVKMINPPVAPLIERMSVSYKAVETIDFRVYPKNDITSVLHIYPLGYKTIYPAKENKPAPFVFSMDTDANLLFGFSNIVGEEYIHLFIDFYPQKKEIQTFHLPRIRWYWGNGYEWHVLPDDAISVNTTQNLLASGKIKIYLPDTISDEFRDRDGLVWIRAGITENHASISEIRQICTNVVKATRDMDCMEKELPEGFILNTPVHTLPGVESVDQVTSIFPGQKPEDHISKLIRISEFITHRNKAVTPRDYERITLQAFPQIGKVKCLTAAGSNKDGPLDPGTVTLVVIPIENKKGIRYRPYATPELLMEIEQFFALKTSGYVKKIHVINPVYEEIMVRYGIDFYLNDQSKAFMRAVVRKVINTRIAPWQFVGDLPVFGYAFGLHQIYEAVQELDFVKSIHHLSVVQLSQTSGSEAYFIREYKDNTAMILPTCPYAISVPFKHHHIGTEVIRDFGIEEMGINEYFVIWPNETGEH